MSHYSAEETLPQVEWQQIEQSQNKWSVIQINIVSTGLKSQIVVITMIYNCTSVNSHLRVLDVNNSDVANQIYQPD